jgi:hypothetical protein
MSEPNCGAYRIMEDVRDFCNAGIPQALTAIRRRGR